MDKLLGDGAGFHKQFMIHYADLPDQSPFINAAHLIQHDLGILIEAAGCALPAGKQYLEGVDLSYRCLIILKKWSREKPSFSAEETNPWLKSGLFLLVGTRSGQ